MKKMIKIFAVAAVAALACVSCKIEVEPSVLPAEEGIQIAVVADMPITKTELSGVSDVVWTDGVDKVGFFNHTADVNVPSSEADVDGSGKASFTATVPSDGTYYAYYPYQADPSYAPDAEGVTVRIPNAQSPTPASFDPKADLLVSTGFAADGATDTPASIQFKRLASFIRIQFVDNTTGSVLADQYATSVAIQGENNLSGRFKISGTDGLIDMSSGYKKITATYAADTYKLTQDGKYAFFGVKPQTLANGSTLIISAVTGKYSITKTVTMPKDVVLGAGDILPIKVKLTDADLPVTVERVWGKYSTSENYWNSYFSGTASSDRNIAMDDEYIYLPETTAAAKMWRIPLDGITDPSLVNVEGVAGGTHALSCVRVVPNTAAGVNGGKDFLMASNLTTSSGATALTVYSWSNGTSDAPVSESVINWRNLRLGDKFSVYGSLQDGALFFRDWNVTNANGEGTILVLRMAWSEAPHGGYFNPRITFSYEDSYADPEAAGGINAYYPYPGDASNGFIANVSTTSKFASFANSPLNTNPNSSGTFTESSGYYSNTAGYNYITFNGKKYIAYVKNAGNGDGRFYVLQGEASDTWQELLGAKRKVIYQADIQQNLAYADGEYHEDLATGVTKTSDNSAIDCAARVIGDDVYFAALKQGVGLSLFKLSLK